MDLCGNNSIFHAVKLGMSVCYMQSIIIHTFHESGGFHLYTIAFTDDKNNQKILVVDNTNI